MTNTLQLKLLKRDRINNELSAIFQYPLVIITAPMGYGKTVAVKLFLKNYQHSAIWVNMYAPIKVSACDFFWYLIVKELYKFNHDLARSLEECGFPKDSVQLSRIVDHIKNLGAFPDDIVLVIDDYHLIENDQINYALKRLVLENIPRLHLVLISRHIPSINIHELNLKGFIYHIDTKDLTFTNDEIYDYFDLVDFQAAENVKQKICSYSSGWISAIYLMIKSYDHHNKLECYNSVNTMLRSSVYDKYDQDTKELLLKLSIFDYITAEQAIYIFGGREVIQTLDQLCKENAFIRLDAGGKYKFHHIFLEFLRNERMGLDIDMRDVIQRAAQWYSDNNHHMQAISFWMTIQDYEKILEEMERAGSNSIYSIDKEALFEVFESIPDELKYKYPIAMLKYIFFVIIHKDKCLGNELLASLEKYFEVHSHEEYSQKRIMAEINIARTTLAFNDAASIANYSRKALNLLGEEHSILRTQNSVLTYGTPHFSYYYHKTPGEYKKIVDIIAEEFDSHVQVTNGCGMGCNHLVIAEHDLETGNLEKVELNAKKAIYEAKTCDQTCIIVCAKLTLARLYILQNRDADLLAVITELTEMARLENNPVNLNVIENCLGYIYACLEQYKNIPQWLRDGDMAFNSLYQGAAFCNIVYGKAILLSENYLELELKTDNFVHDFKVFNNLLGLIHNHIHNAVAKFHLYGIEAGVQELQKALDIAVQDNVIMPFVENKDHILPMLKSKQLDVPKHYFERLLKFCEQYRREISKIDEANLLSLREYEVFALIESGKSYKYIADKLCISPNTVKRHIQNIYRKLNVTNKVMAIKKYKSLKEEIMK